MKAVPKSFRIRVENVQPASDEHTIKIPIKFARKGAHSRRFSKRGSPGATRRARDGDSDSAL